MVWMKKTFTLWISLSLFLGLSACSTNPVTGKQDLVLMSEQQEIAMGQQYHQQVLKSSPPYQNAELQRYVNRIGQELARASHRSDLSFHFTVVDSPDINAFALPGGYIYITRGIMAYLNSEAELAGVIGHEIGHVTARHGVRQQTAQTFTGLGAAVLAAAVGVDGRLTNTLGTALVRGYGRSHELEADRLGAEYLAKVGFEPTEMIEVVRVLKNQELYSQQTSKNGGGAAKGYHGLFSTHPDNDTRLKEVIAAAKRYASAQPRSDGKSEYLKMLNGVVFGQNADQGIVRGNRFYHEGLNVSLTAPEGWRIENMPKQLVFIAPENQLVTIVRLDSTSKAASPKAFIQGVLGVTGLRSAEPYTLGNKQGFKGRALAEKSPFDGPRVAEINVLYDGGNAWSFVTYAKESGGLDLFERKIDSLTRSMAPLTPKDRALARPKQIRVVQAKAGDTYESLARRSALTENAATQLRLINGQFPSGRLKAGQWVKVVE